MNSEHAKNSILPILIISVMQFEPIPTWNQVLAENNTISVKDIRFFEEKVY